VKGHFGPINTISFSPDGLRCVYAEHLPVVANDLQFISYTSGSEDGYLRIHHLGDQYLRSALEDKIDFEELDIDEL